MVAFNFSAKIHLNFMRSCILNDKAKNKLEKSIELILTDLFYCLKGIPFDEVFYFLFVKNC